MFCPNCGAQNPETATDCHACHAALHPASGGAGPSGAAMPAKPGGGKFKGTMLMVQNPLAAVEASKAPAAPPRPAAPPEMSSAPYSEPEHTAPASAPAKKPGAYAKTMVGGPGFAAEMQNAAAARAAAAAAPVTPAPAEPAMTPPSAPGFGAPKFNPPGGAGAFASTMIAGPMDPAALRALQPAAPNFTPPGAAPAAPVTASPFGPPVGAPAPAASSFTATPPSATPPAASASPFAAMPPEASKASWSAAQNAQFQAPPNQPMGGRMPLVIGGVVALVAVIAAVAYAMH